MAQIEHKYFLIWLLYGSIVLFSALTASYLGYLDIVFSSDPTYISQGLSVLFVFTECYIGYKIYNLSREHNYIAEFERLYKSVTLKFIPVSKSIILSELIGNLSRKKDNDSKLLLESVNDQIIAKNQGPFIAEIMVRIGLFGTIIGLIIAFLPFIIQSFDTQAATAFTANQIKLIIGSLFQGVSTAFFTTATGLFYGTLIIISSKIYESCQISLMYKLTVISETIIKPNTEDN